MSDEITASINLRDAFDLLRWAVGISGLLLTSMAGAIAYIYRDSRSERLQWRSEMKSMNVELQMVVKQNNEAFRDNSLALRELSMAISNQEKAIERLDAIIERIDQRTR